MNPGRELDALIAEKVMGLTVVEHPVLVDVKRGETLQEKCYWNGPELLRIPLYSSDIAHAWEAVEKLKSNGLVIKFVDFSNDYQSRSRWEVEFISKGNIGVNRPSMSGALPHAICLAALKAVEKA